MNVLLFGSAFNPPHWGHELLVRQSFELINKIDEIWLLPSYTHSFGKVMASVEHRLNMTRIFASNLNDSRVKVCPLEIDYKTSGETWDVYELLKNEFEYLNKTMNLIKVNSSKIKYSFLMGTDQLPRFHEWDRYRELVKVMQFYIYPRPGYPPTPLMPHMKLLESETQVVTNLSSTLVRNRMINNLSIDRLVNDEIKDYVGSQSVYLDTLKQK